MFDVVWSTVIFLVHAKPLKKLVVWLNVVFFCVCVATIPAPPFFLSPFFASKW